ncbi:MAG: hypothetical protein HZA01_06295 [Nitrospinae bacterium]|nr:hypothetical protein [Nitrospinota bacterium]
MIQFIAKALDKLQPYVPLLQSFVWPAFISIVLFIYKKQAREIIGAVRQRIERGSSFKAGPLEIGEDLKQLEYAQPSQDKNIAIDKAALSWEQERNDIYKKNDGYFLTHVLTPSRSSGQKYDIYIYLIKHKTTDLSAVEFSEFFFGHMWGNKVFKEYPKRGVIGISTSAYGPFLCTCRVHLKDGTVVVLNRYIDFEMGKMIDAQHKIRRTEDRDADFVHKQ